MDTAFGKRSCSIGFFATWHERARRVNGGSRFQRSNGNNEGGVYAKAGLDEVAEQLKQAIERMRHPRLVHHLAPAALLAFIWAQPGPGLAAPAPHESPHAYCARVGTDDVPRPTPPSLFPAVKRLFNFGGRVPLRATYYRCAEGHVKVCAVGANLPCEKANTSNHLPAAARWCETHPGTEIIPAYITGHDTLYSWHCTGAKAETGAPVGALDARGFFADYWKTVE